MAITKLYSERQKELRGEVIDVYIYDQIPVALRNQFWMITEDILGGHYQYVHDYNDNFRDAVSYIVQALCREYGTFKLSDYSQNSFDDLKTFVLTKSTVEQFIDAAELIMRIIDVVASGFQYRKNGNAREHANDAIAEINYRFKRAGLGFEYIGNEIVRIDSQFVHQEAVKPALLALSGEGYSGAQQEFMSAFEHYRHGRSKEVLVDCLKAFESTMKAICEKRGWQFTPRSTAKDLIQICLDNELIPKYWQQHFSSLRAGLESGIPTARNKTSGHGQGVKPTEVPEEIASYMLHMTASTILFLSRSEDKLSSARIPT